MMRNFLNRYINFFSSLLAIIAGLLFGLIIMIITNPQDASSAFFTILSGGFEDGFTSISRTILYATPIIFTGLSVGFAFKTGLFNIGASGQVMIGAFVAIYIGVKWSFLGPIHWVIALIFAGLAGALWALLPGLLKAYRNVHEVVSTIMMNYIGLYLVMLLVKRTVFNQEKNESMYVLKNAVIPSFTLERLINGLSKIVGSRFAQSIEKFIVGLFKLINLDAYDLIINYGFFISILVVIIIYIILQKTTFGYELKAVGFNKDASKYAGVNEKRSIVLSMLIAGGLSGLAGGIIYLNDIGRSIEVVDVLNPEGFIGIPVALIGLSHPIGILFAGIFMGYITLGGFYMQIHDFAPEIIDIIISSIIYFSALVIIFKEFINRMSKRRMSRGERND